MMLTRKERRNNMTAKKIILNGIIDENPALILVLGTCPTLAVTTSAINGLGMGVATMFVLLFSNILISLTRNLIPDKVRLIAFIIIIATFVTIADLLMQAFTPTLHQALGIFIPLIVVNCLVLARAESFAQRNTTWNSIFDALGMGIGFTVALLMMGIIRELLGNGSIFDYKIVAEGTKTILIFVLPPGAFITYGYLVAIFRRNRKTTKC